MRNKLIKCIISILVIVTFVGCKDRGQDIQSGNDVKKVEDNSKETIGNESKVDTETDVVKDEDSDNTVVNDSESGNEDKYNNEVVSEIKYNTYYNSRFGCKIDYPDFLIEQPAPQNDDGRVFLSEDGTVSLTCSGINNAIFTTAEEMYNKDVERTNNIIYKNLSGRPYVISWEENNEIYYNCFVVGEGAINSFYIKYPKEKAEIFDEIVSRAYESFTPGDISRGH